MRGHEPLPVPWTRPGRLAVSLVLVGLLVTGCGSNPEPPPVDAGDTSASPSASASSAPEPPEMPAKAEEKSRAGAKAFVRYYIRLVNHAMATGGTEQLRHHRSPSCSTCDAIIARIDQVYAEGGRLSGEGWKLAHLQVVDAQSSRKLLVAASIAITPQTLHPSDGTPSTSAKSRGNLDFHLRHTGEAWEVARLDAVQ